MAMAFRVVLGSEKLGTEPPGGVALAPSPGGGEGVGGPLSGRIIATPDGVTLALGHADWGGRPLAEVRWQVDHAIRRVRRALDLRGAAVVFAPESPESGVPPQVADAIAADLSRAFGGLAAGSVVSARHAALAAREDLFRRWANEDATTRTSLQIAADVEAWAAENPTVATLVLDETALREAGCGLLLSVGGASAISPPRLVLCRYTPADPVHAARPAWMLLGKGVTFDTGGINVKPYESFVSHMKNDMAGAAVAFALFAQLVADRFERPLVLAIPTCENPIGENATRPGTIVKSHRGLRVKVDHTDAEGRLILADGLSYAEALYAPERTFSFATLTTAALSAYGPYATPVHFAPPEVEAAFAAASAVTGDDLHFFPRRLWHFEANRDDEADLKNTARMTGAMPYAAGSRSAAHFLLHFAKAPLVHWDIFASTWNWGGEAPGAGYGATGVPFRVALEGLARLHAASVVAGHAG